MNGVPLAGLPKVRQAQQEEVEGHTAVLENGTITLTLRTKVPGTAHVFAWDVDWAEAYRAAVDAPHVVVDTGSHGLVNRTITIDVSASDFTDGYVVIAWQPAGAEGWQSIAVPVVSGDA